MNKPNCYDCKHRSFVAGSAHSSCHYPGNDTGMLSFFANTNMLNAHKLKIKANEHGVRSGWFMWPVDFDPVWLTNCEGFEQKAEK